MAKTASQRRLGKRTRALAHLENTNPEQLKWVLETLLRGWVREAIYRAKAYRREDVGDFQPLKAFGMVDHAVRHIAGLGPTAISMAVPIVATLKHECAKAVSQAGDHNLYAFNQKCAALVHELNVRNRFNSCWSGLADRKVKAGPVTVWKSTE